MAERATFCVRARAIRRSASGNPRWPTTGDSAEMTEAYPIVVKVQPQVRVPLRDLDGRVPIIMRSFSILDGHPKPATDRHRKTGQLM